MLRGNDLIRVFWTDMNGENRHARGRKSGEAKQNKGFGLSWFFSFLIWAVLAGVFLSGCGGNKPAPQVEEASEDMAEALEDTAEAASLETAENAAAEETAAETIPEEVRPTTETALVGICLARTGNGDNDRFLLEVLPALEFRGFLPENIIVKKTTKSRTTQDRQIDECLEENCKTLILSAVSDERIPEMADRVAEAGAQAVFINCDPGEEELRRWKEEKLPCVWIGNTYSQKLACQMTILYLYSGTERGLDFNQDGHVGAILVGGGDEAHKALEEAVRDLGSELQILGETDSEDFQEISDYMQQVINERKKEVELVLCSSEDFAHAAADGVQLRHRLVGRDILVIGMDAHEDTCTSIINKLMTGAIFTDFYEQASLAAVAAKDLLEGNQQEASIPAVIFKVTEDNAQEILDQLWMAGEKAAEGETAAEGNTAAVEEAAAEGNTVAEEETAAEGNTAAEEETAAETEAEGETLEETAQEGGE